MEKKVNPLGVEPINKLLRKFAVPSIVAMLVSSLYNIVDQFFIGQKIGALGNAATNIAFPLSVFCTATALLCGIGGASSYNLSLGRGETKKAPFFLGNALGTMISVGVIWALIVQVFLQKMLVFVGSPADVLPYAMEYTRITSYGFPFLIISIGGGHLLRADGRPQMTMICNLTGAVINTILDALFVFGFEWGMTGAAWATVIGQICATLLVFWGLANCKTTKLSFKHLIPRLKYVKVLTSLGLSSFINQVAMMIVQVVMNKTLKYYGGLSIYGESIPIAVVGISSKINMLFMAFIIGFSQSLQPIASFNYGARNYKRVKEGYLKAILCGTIIAVFSFACFQLFPRQIIGVFGSGSKEYFDFGIKFFRISLFFTFINSIQPITANFFSAIGKPLRGAFLSLTRQIIFLLPLIILLPKWFGIDGAFYTWPIADLASGLTGIGMVLFELKKSKYRNEL